MARTFARIDSLRRALLSEIAVADREFDALYPLDVRSLSRGFWTPVRVAQRAAKLLAPAAGSRVLDVGAGVGKFCIVATAATGVSVTGLEQRGRLVDIAREAAKRLEIRAEFVHGDLSTIDWTGFDSFYFYNPFFENIHAGGNHIDETVELSQRRFTADMRTALDAIARAKVGTRVVTYHGLGAPMPTGYRLEATESAGSDELNLWVKSASPANETSLT